MNRRFLALGHRLYRWRFQVLVAWCLLLLVGMMGAKGLSIWMLGGTAAIPGSPSQALSHELRTDFQNPYTRLLLVAIESDRATVRDPSFQHWIQQARDRLQTMPQVSRVTTYLDTHDALLCSADGHQTVLMVGLRSASMSRESDDVPLIREALLGLRGEMRHGDPTAHLEVTGNAAITYDINQYSKHDGQQAESRALPVTLLILLFAFGSPLAAGIPLIIAMVGTTLALGAAFLLAHLMHLSNLLENIVTMIGLAIGIDYSLLMVSRFREARATSLSAREAMTRALGQAGPAIVCSGATVMIGLLGLLFSPLMELRSISLGGALVVMISVLAAVTLLPVLLVLLASWLDAPLWLSRSLNNPHSDRRWEQLAEWIMNRPIRVLLLALILVLALAAPATRIHLGFPDGRWLPRNMESRKGAEILAKMGNTNAVIPLYLVVHATDGQPILAPDHLQGLWNLTRRLEDDRRVGTVLGPLSLRPDLGLLQYAMLYANPSRALKQYPAIGELYLSNDRSSAFFEVIPANRLPIAQAQQLANDLAHLSLAGPLRLQVGGDPVYYNDFNEAMRRSFPWVFGFVLGTTLLVLFWAFRSYLLPIKAVVMNLFSVAAGYGVLVMVFQFGWLKQVIGLQDTLSAIPLTIPMMMFCIVFGLSMDYEVFLLARIQEIYRECGDNRQATAQGLASTGGIISSAALVMIAVFGAFARAQIAIIKMLGLGLAVSVLVDATLIRIFMVPAFMRLAGRWNWAPGPRVPAGKAAGYTAQTMP